MYHLYADDTTIYCCASSASQALHYLQSAFEIVQSRLCQLKLVLNIDKTKVIFFSKSKALPRNLTEMISSQETKIKCLASTWVFYLIAN